MSESKAIAALQEQRRAVSEATLADTGFDLASLTDEQFDGGLQRIKVVYERAKRVLATVLVPGVHFGNPVDRNGNEAFQRPILYKSGAQELRRFMKLRLHTVDKQIVETEDYVSVVLEVVAMDTMGRIVGRSLGACNTREKRFRNRANAGWTYQDAREKLHDCLMMAEKRAGVAATLEASGATGLFADEDLLEEAIEDGRTAEQSRPEVTPEQKKEMYRLALKRGFDATSFRNWLERENATGLTVYADQVMALIGILESAAPPAAPKPVEVEVVEPKAEKAPAREQSFDAFPEALRDEPDDLPFP